MTEPFISKNGEALKFYDLMLGWFDENSSQGTSAADTSTIPTEEYEKTTKSIELKDILPVIASAVYKEATNNINAKQTNELLSLTIMIQELKNKTDTIEKALTDYNKNTIIKYTIFSLSSEEYSLLRPIDVILTIYDDEVLASIPELEIYGEGETDIEAIKELKLEILDLYDDLNEMNDDELGKDPKLWKLTINQLVKKCQ